MVGETLGRSRIVEQIGEGGTGEVYQATDTKLNRQVALKILPEAFATDPDRLARFQREAQVLASLNHPNIAAIYGLEEADNTRAFVLELVEGPTLADRIAHTSGRVADGPRRARLAWCSRRIAWNRGRARRAHRRRTSPAHPGSAVASRRDAKYQWCPSGSRAP